MRRYFRIVGIIIKTAIIRDTMFRGAFLIEFLIPLFWLGLFIGVVEIIFGHTEALAGWSRGNMLVLLGVWSFIDDLTGATFWYGVNRLPDLVANGTLDVLYTRPIDSQFIIATERFSLSRFLMVVPDGLLIVFGLAESHVTLSIGGLVSAFLLIITGCILFFAILFCFNTLGFWFMRINNIGFIFEGIENMTKYPVDVFGRVIKLIFMTILPFAVMFMFPAQAFLGRITFLEVLYAIAIAVVFFMLARMFYRYSLHRYSSVA